MILSFYNHVTSPPAKITKQIWIRRFKQCNINNEFSYEKSIIISGMIKIKIYHKICGRYFFQTPNKHWHGHGCNYLDCLNVKKIKIDTSTYANIC